MDEPRERRGVARAGSENQVSGDSRHRSVRSQRGSPVFPAGCGELAGGSGPTLIYYGVPLGRFVPRVDNLGLFAILL